MTGSCTEVIERKFAICIEIWQVEMEDGVWRVSFHKYAYVHGDPVQGIDPTGLFAGVLLSVGIGMMIPSPSDSIKGALETLVSEYALNLEWDIAWAQDWTLEDSLSTRSDNQWVEDAMLEGAIGPWNTILRLLGGDLSDDEDDFGPGVIAAGVNAMAMARPSSPSIRVTPRIGMATIRPVHGSNGELKSAFSQITPANIGKGTNTNAASRRYVRALGKPDDDAGHAIGKELGGAGGVRGRNVFPQSIHFNRGKQARIEAGVKADVMAGKQVFVRVVPKYHGGSKRPHEIVYQIRTDGVTKLHRIANP